MRLKDRLIVMVCGMTLCAGAASAQVVVRGGPPPPVVVERPGPPLHPGWVWTGGFYRWDGRRYVWMPGHWVNPPRPRAVWIPGQWVPRGGGWVWRPGHWRY
jgi:hypothetical protein